MERTQPRARAAHSGLTTRAVDDTAGIRRPGFVSGASPADRGPSTHLALEMHFLDTEFWRKRDTLLPGKPSSSLSGEIRSCTGEKTADWTLFPHRLCSGIDPPLTSEDTGSFFLLSFQLGPKEGPLLLLTGPGGQEGRGIHHALTLKDERRSLRMASWKAPGMRSDLESLSPSFPEALLPHNLPKTLGKLPKG